jgi:hypothetical protein
MIESAQDQQLDLIAELRTLIGELGQSGGLVSPSVYDTAQLLRLFPPQEGVVPGLQWLLQQQYADGGWGVPTVPVARDVPTLAALLALYTYRHLLPVDTALETGLHFLRRQAAQWQHVQIDLVPIGAEMIFPYLLQAAEEIGLEIDQRPYAHLFELRRHKLARLANAPLSKHDSPTFSWEALGYPYTPDVLDAWTGVGHSPAATAAWLAKAQSHPVDPALLLQAEAYLARAAATTGLDIPGVVPLVYPITGFELCYALYPLLLTGLLNHPALADVVPPQIERLRAMVDQAQGLGFGEGFIPDVDCTSVAVAVLLAAKQPTDIAYVRRFRRENHFYTYVWELNPSVLSNTHALYALVRNDERCHKTEEFLIERQETSGAWMVDKWHTSWRYSTLEVIASFQTLDYQPQVLRAVHAFVNDQNADGSWGADAGAKSLETAYAVIALGILGRNIPPAAQRSVQRGQAWLNIHGDCSIQHELNWLGKEVYSAVRVDQAYRLCARLLSPVTLAPAQVAVPRPLQNFSVVASS